MKMYLGIYLFQLFNFPGPVQNSLFLCFFLTLPFLQLRASLVAQTVKNPPATWQTWVRPGLGRSPGEGNDYPLQYSVLENSMDRSLAGYSLWGCKESDTTEQLSLFFSRDPINCPLSCVPTESYTCLMTKGQYKQHF